MGVHLAGILLAGVGLGLAPPDGVTRSRRVAAAPRTTPWRSRRPLALAASSCSRPPWTERGHYDAHGGGAHPRAAGGRRDATAATSTGWSRSSRHAATDASTPACARNWGKRLQASAPCPCYAWLADRDVDAIGFTFRTIASLSNDIEAVFDETNPAHYEMFNVRYLILPPDRKPERAGEADREQRPATALYEVSTTGYFQVVDRAARGRRRTARTSTTRRATSWHRTSPRAAIYPGVAFAGGAAPRADLLGRDAAAGPAGPGARAGRDGSQDGVFTATVEANRRAVVLLKATYDPRWTATVDGAPAKPVMMAPSLVGVDVPPGRHEVRFRYEPYAHYPLLLAIGLLTLLGLALFERRELWPARVGQWAGRTAPERATSSERAGEGS